MSKPNNKAFKNALRDAIDMYGSQKELAKRAGIPESNIGKYLSDQIKNIQDRTLEKLSPYLDEDLLDFERPLDESISIKSKYTESIIRTFEQLDKHNQRHVLAYADDILQEQEFGRPDPLTPKEVEKLQAVGIDCYHGYELQVSTRGLWWLYNVIEQERSYVLLDNVYISELLNYEYPVEQFRDLHIQAFKINTKRHAYYQYAFYLDGTPPKLYTMARDATSQITDRFNLGPGINTPFKLNDYSDISIVFTKEEMDALRNGETLRIAYSD